MKLKSRKNNGLYYFITLLFLLLASSSNILSYYDAIWFIIIGFMFIVAVSKKLLNKQSLKPIYIFSGCFLGFILVRYLINVSVIDGIDFSFLLSDVVFLFKYIYISYLFCIILREEALEYIIKVVTHLTIISFFFYALQLCVSSETFYSYSMSLNLTPKNLIPGFTSFILFGFTKGYHDYSNSGFLWEPGLFGCFLVITLLLNLFSNKFRFDRRSIILVVGIITTFSTAVYLGFILVVFLVYRIKVPKLKPSFFLIITIFILLIIFIPFLGAKVFDTYLEDMADVNRLKQLAPFYKSINMSYVPLNRFGSMAYLYNTFGPGLILGISNKYDVILNRILVVNISNGDFEFMAKFGLVGFIYLMYKYGKYCLSFVLKTEYLIYCLLILFVLAFGEPMLAFPIILMFIFLPPNRKKDMTNERDEAPELEAV